MTIFSMLFLIFTFKDQNVAEYLTNLADQLKKVGPCRALGAFFFQLCPSPQYPKTQFPNFPIPQSPNLSINQIPQSPNSQILKSPNPSNPQSLNPPIPQIPKSFSVPILQIPDLQIRQSAKPSIPHSYFCKQRHTYPEIPTNK